MSEQEWPIDFESLHRDMNISASVVESAYNTPITSKAYWIAHQKFVAAIKERRPDLAENVRGFETYSVRIMVDLEAAAWKRSRAKRALGEFARCGVDHSRISRETFSAQEKSEAAVFDGFVGATVLAVAGEDKKLQRALRALQPTKALASGVKPC
jgi:hypothetical protein